MLQGRVGIGIRPQPILEAVCDGYRCEFIKHPFFLPDDDPARPANATLVVARLAPPEPIGEFIATVLDSGVDFAAAEPQLVL